MCRISGRNRYILARKSVKLYMKDVVACDTKSITTSNAQTLYLDGDDAAYLKGKKVLIVDDICSKGFTFYYAGQKLRDLGASDVRLFISHCEDNIQNGRLLDEDVDVISKVYTTDSICHINNEKIDFIRIFRV
jgi:phosphoribosylpyrophosphate synthetase